MTKNESCIVKQIPLGNLFIPAEFVRNSYAVRRTIWQNFSWDKFGALVVKPRHKSHSCFDVVDGVVRTQVVRALDFAANTSVPCVLIAKDANILECRLALNGYVSNDPTTRCRKNLSPAEVFELKYRNKCPETMLVVDLLHEHGINIRWASNSKKRWSVGGDCFNAELFARFAQLHGIKHVERLLSFLSFFRVDGGEFIQAKALQACFLQAANNFLLAKTDCVFQSSGSVVTVKGKTTRTKAFGHIDADKIYEDAFEYVGKGLHLSQAICNVLTTTFSF